MPLLMDLTNPSGGNGWGNRERQSLSDRGPCNLVLALAVIHHLAIGNNVPFERIAGYFAELGRALLIEFVPKEDSQVKRLLVSRADIFNEYTIDKFEAAFKKYFMQAGVHEIEGSGRVLYLLKRIES